MTVCCSVSLNNCIEEMVLLIVVSDGQSDTHSTVASIDAQLSVDSAFPDTSIDLQYIKGQT